MERRPQVGFAVAGAVGLFVLVQVGALALVAPFESAGFQAVENPSDPTNSVLYVGLLLVTTAAMLAAIRLGIDWLLRGFIVLTAGVVSLYVFSVVLPPVAVVDGITLLPWLAAAAVAVALVVHPEWYVIDAAGVVMGAGAAAIFGISFGVLPAIVLLSVLAVYDAISVYGTEHMLTLASGVMELKVPVVLVVPMDPGYSFVDDGHEATAVESAADGGEADAGERGGESAGEDAVAAGPMERDAFFIGLGDAVMPTIMAASAAFFVDAPSLGVPGIALNLPALGAVVGTLAGLLVLLRMVLAGRAHAGLPLLNGGAIAGYLLGALVAGISLVDALGLGPYV